MSFSDAFIDRPVATSLLTIALGLAGAIAYGFLPVSPLPPVEFPTIQVQASLPGASPETMASSVATPLERQLGRIAGVNELTSTSNRGACTVVLQFELSRNIDAAARDVQAAINAARSQLPTSLPANPTYRKVNPADAPIAILSVASETYGIAEMYDAAASILQQKLSQMKGVGQVTIGGGALPAVRIDLDPTALDGAGIGFADVREALFRANANRPKGSITEGDRAYSIDATDQLKKAKQYERLIVAWRRGAAVRLGDVAAVTDGLEDVRTGGTANGTPAVLLVVFRQPGANIIETVDRVRAAVPQLQAELPAAMRLAVVLDRSSTIRASVHEVQVTLALSICLVILVVFAFLRDVRATIVPSVAVPSSLVATFGVMYLCGYSVDNLSLMALTIATGFVVDDAIVVIENVTRYMEKGLSPLEASRRGVREIGFTVVSMSVSLVAVFLPILLMGGIVGRLFREFAVVLSTAIGVSLVVSLTTTPMMCARILRPAHARRHGLLYRVSERLFLLVLAAYDRTLRVVLRHRLATLLVMLSTVGVTIWLYVISAKGFFPQQDTGRLGASLVADQQMSFSATRRLLARCASVVREDPAVESVIAFTGGSGATNTGRMFVALKPLGERRLSADLVIARLRPKLAAIAGASLFLQPVQDLRVGGMPTSSQYQYTLRGDGLEELNEWAPRVMEKVRTLPGLVDVTSNQQDRGLLYGLAIDRDSAARLGITARATDDALYDAFGQRQVSTTYSALNQYHVVMEIDPRFSQSPEGLAHVYVRAADGGLAPLSAFARAGASRTLLAVTHAGQFPSVTVSFNLRPGVSLGTAVDAIERAGADMGIPSTIHGSFSGTAQAFQASLANQPYLIMAALAAVYIVLGVLYESLVHPLTILSTLPSAGVGALLALQVSRNELNVISLIGIVLLIGIVKKNAILMIDFALDAERREGKRPEDAIHEACLLRFRPIIMTTMAALLGGLPLALGRGTGSELRRPLGIAIVGGLVFSQALTLYTTPVVYLYLGRVRGWQVALGLLSGLAGLAAYVALR